MNKKMNLRLYLGDDSMRMKNSVNMCKKVGVGMSKRESEGDYE